MILVVLFNVFPTPYRSALSKQVVQGAQSDRPYKEPLLGSGRYEVGSKLKKRGGG